MWFFKNKKSSPTIDLSWLGTDMHSHLLPGIDDGAPDIAASLELIKGLQALGYKRLITTPHILWEVYPNTPETITAALTEVRKATAEAGLDVELHAAAEYFIDEYFEQALQNKAPLLTLGGNKVLVEFSMITAPMDLLQVLFQMQVNGYQPVVAHPERYIYLATRKQVFDELRNAGCLFQLNLLSLTGYYGRSVQELAEHLCKKDCYSLAGTDLHNGRHLAGLQKLSSSSAFTRLKESGLLQNASL